jgi:uncharacterized protein YigE (DUF2233 family)
MRWLLATLLCTCGSSDAPEMRASRDEDPATELSFQLADVDLRLVPVVSATPLREAAQTVDPSRLVLAVNAGFFDAELRPVGLAMNGGQPFAPLDPTLSGGVLWISDGVGHLTATEDYREVAVDLAVQCRPRLVVQGQNNIRRDDGVEAARTALCLRRRGEELVVVRRATEDGSGPSLYALARELVDLGCEDALNLDGGPSVAWGTPGGPWLEPRTPIAMVLVVERKVR